MSIEAILYVKPLGLQKAITISDINQEDEDWFKNNNVLISMEEIEDNYVVYAQLDIEDDNGNWEAIEISNGRSCKDTMAALRIESGKLLKEYKKTL
jgi:hypothetical protein